jgi:hypothetical protein
MKKHNILMSAEEYFAVKNFLVELKQQGKFNNDVYMMKFYKAFAVNSYIKLERNKKLFDNPDAVVTFELDNDQTLLATIGLFCREYSMDLVKKDPIIARALRKIKDYISVELLDLFNL